jgi:hypothetical protein
MDMAAAGLIATVSTERQMILLKAICDRLHWVEASMDFAHALRSAAAAGCQGFPAFDQRLARSVSRLGSIPVAVP